MTTKEEKTKKKDKKRKRRKEEEEDEHDDDGEDRKLDKKLRKLLHLAPAKAQVQQAPSPFPPVKAPPPPPRLPPVAPPPPQAPHLPAFNKHVKNTTISTASTAKVPIPSLRADDEEIRRRQARAQRFAASSSLASSRPSSSSSSSSSAFLSQESRRRKETKEKDHKRARALVGTCAVVEKEYMRSMEEVDPATVRPPRVLREALQRVKAHWTAKEDYEYACSQLKSIRQDLRVQHIEDAFTIHVYETHARIALEAGDLSEFLVAAARLDELRRLPSSSSSSSLPSSSSAAEFLSYRLLHALFLGHPAQIRLLLLQAREQEDMWNDPAVVHARAVLRAHAQGNYHRFFQLYNQAPNMSAYLIDFMLLRMRRLALPRVLAAYGPASLPLLFLSHELGFDNEEECRQFVVEKEGWVIGREGGREGGWVVDLRATRTRRKDGGKEWGGGKVKEEEERGKDGEKKKKTKKEKKKEKKEKNKKKKGSQRKKKLK